MTAENANRFQLPVDASRFAAVDVRTMLSEWRGGGRSCVTVIDVFGSIAGDRVFEGFDSPVRATGLRREVSECVCVCVCVRVVECAADMKFTTTGRRESYTVTRKRYGAHDYKVSCSRSHLCSLTCFRYLTCLLTVSK